jgi:hypothetical protein
VAELRRATPADADALADVVAEGFVSYLDFAPDGWTAPDRLGLAMGFAVQLHAPDLVCWVAAEPDGTIIGQVAVRPASQHRIKADDPDLAHLGHLFVRRARWGTGLATRLLGTAIDDAEGPRLHRDPPLHARRPRARPALLRARGLHGARRALPRGAGRPRPHRVPAAGAVKRALLAALLACAVVAGALLAGPSGGAGGWRAAGTSENPRTEVTAARVGGHAYVIGGYAAPDGRTTGLNERYDLRRGTWRTVAPIPQPVNHAASGAYRGDVYVVGGDTGGRPTDAFWRYRPRTDRWTRMPAAPTARSALGAAVIGHRLFAVGGVAGEALTTLEIFDFRTRRWSRGPSMRVAREHLGVTAARGRLYAIAGRTARDGNFAAVERYDPRRRRWQRLPGLRRARGGNAAAATDRGRVVALGGEEGAGTIAEVEVFDARRRRWRPLADMRTPRHGLGAVGFGDRIVALQGGPEPGLHYSGAAESLRVR